MGTDSTVGNKLTNKRVQFILQLLIMHCINHCLISVLCDRGLFMDPFLDSIIHMVHSTDMCTHPYVYSWLVSYFVTSCFGEVGRGPKVARWFVTDLHACAAAYCTVLYSTQTTSSNASYATRLQQQQHGDHGLLGHGAIE